MGRLYLKQQVGRMASLDEVRAALRDATPGTMIGSDECGFGSWAGELVTCAVAAPCDWDPHDPMVRDSKQLSPAQREQVYTRYFNQDAEDKHKIVISPYGIDVEELNMYPIHACLKRAHRGAIEGTFWRLTCSPIVIVDGIVDPELEKGLTHAPKVFCLPKADALVPAVALASIIAKVTRDRMMVEWGKKYPGYGFEKHSGYGTPQHQEALDRLGPCPIHRTQYAPIRRALETRAANFFDLMDEPDRKSGE